MARALEEYLAAVEAGTAPPREEFLARHPALADDLDACLAALHFIGRAAEGPRSVAAGAAGPEPPEPAPGRLGDFRLIREVGRGGMGVVYEAEQVSLGRRVALKVLPFASTMDPRQLQRFHNEARAAAALDHPHIVHVHAVGSERGVHFYAMQYIEGQTLAALIAGRRPGAGRPVAPEAQATGPYVPGPAAADTAPRPAASTERGPHARGEFRRAAELGVQAAEALDHAHQLGIVHRDVKPANLLVDGRGGLWVTDFGLAQVQSDARLTLTGDLVGTLRYMSPEQALAKRVVVDHRTDVYSLGATLYELLTLEPAFRGNDRQELLRQIAFEEPVPPRRHDRAILPELETIVLKALEKNPAERYATAKELAEDLGRFLADQPIRARRPSWAQVAGKWARRHRPAVWAGAAVLLVAAVLGGGTWLWWAQKRAVATGEARAALQEATQLGQEERWPEASSAVRRAEGVLAGVGANPDLRQQIHDLGKDLEMAGRLEEARLRLGAVIDPRVDWEASDEAYAKAFRWYGWDVDSLDPREAGNRIRSRSIHLQLVVALDDWAFVRRQLGADRRSQLLAASRAADPDPWRNRLRDVLEGKDPGALEELATSALSEDLPPATAVLLSRLADGTPAADRALLCLRQVHQRYPANIWVNHELGYCYAWLRPQRIEEALPYVMACVALRPRSAYAHLNLGSLLQERGRLDEAIAEYWEVLGLNKGDAVAVAVAHLNLGTVLHAKGRLDEAIAECREAIRLVIIPRAHTNLGNALREKGRLDEAIAELQEAIRLKKDDPKAHNDLGLALYAKGRLDEAIAEWREALRLQKDYPDAHNNLGAALRDKGQLDEAITECREAIRLKKDFAGAHSNLGAVLATKGRLDEAITDFREAIRLAKDDPEAHYNLGTALREKGWPDEAIAEYREAIRLKKVYPDAHNNLGAALAEKGQLDEAIAEYREAIRLKKDDPEAHNNIGAALYKKGRLDDAIAEWREAIRLKKDFPGAHNNLGAALADKGRLDEAIAEYREAIRLKKDDPEAHKNLGLALREQERFAEALAAFRRAAELFASSRPDLAKQAEQDVYRCEQLIALEKRLPALLAGKEQPKNNADRLAVAEARIRKKLHARAAQFYAAAFTVDGQLADDPKAGHRYNAACAAALAGCGAGKDAAKLTDAERAGLRKQALDWLRADLDVWRQLLDKAPDKARPTVVQTMQHWLGDADFNGVRGKEALAKLPEAERQAWQQLWADVEKLITKGAP
jgi:tetratricopeptide (TPR) repeat protein